MSSRHILDPEDLEWGHALEAGSFSESQVEGFWGRVMVTESCWLWQGSIDKKGYGAWWRSGRTGMGAHHFAYLLLVGPVPPGLELDHLCSVRNCVNPEHLEPVTHAENVRRAGARKTHCKRGHPFDKVNTLIRPNGARRCRKCTVILQHEYLARKAARSER